MQQNKLPIELDISMSSSGYFIFAALMSNFSYSDENDKDSFIFGLDDLDVMFRYCLIENGVGGRTQEVPNIIPQGGDYLSDVGNIEPEFLIANEIDTSCFVDIADHANNYINLYLEGWSESFVTNGIRSLSGHNLLFNGFAQSGALPSIFDTSNFIIDFDVSFAIESDIKPDFTITDEIDVSDYSIRDVSYETIWQHSFSANSIEDSSLCGDKFELEEVFSLSGTPISPPPIKEIYNALRDSFTNNERVNTNLSISFNFY